MILRWGYFPNEVRQAFAPLLRQYLWLVPSWCRQLYVGFKVDAPPECDATTSGEFEYRQARIYIHPGWLTAAATQRRMEVIHEILHIPLLPVTDGQADLVRRMFGDGDAPKFQATVLDHWVKSFEGSIQDLAFSIAQIPESGLPSVQAAEEEDEPPPLQEAS